MSPVTATSSTQATSSSTSSGNQANSSLTDLANENTFLKLFVAQLKNQDPLSPADGTQFVSQLAQFSELEQVLNISGSVSSIKNAIVPAAAGQTTSSASASTAIGGQATVPPTNTSSGASDVAGTNGTSN